MRVILLQDTPKLGKKHDVKDVSDGYARNFLFPRNLAKPATETALKTVSVEKIRVEQEKSAEYQKYKSLAEKIKSLVLNFKVKLSEKGRAFGSVTAVKIRDSLKKHGVKVEKDWVELEDSIKSTGEKTVKIKLPQGIITEVKIMVESE